MLGLDGNNHPAICLIRSIVVAFSTQHSHFRHLLGSTSTDRRTQVSSTFGEGWDHFCFAVERLPHVLFCICLTLPGAILRAGAQEFGTCVMIKRIGWLRSFGRSGRRGSVWISVRKYVCSRLDGQLVTTVGYGCLQLGDASIAILKFRNDASPIDNHEDPDSQRARDR